MRTTARLLVRFVLLAGLALTLAAPAGASVVRVLTVQGTIGPASAGTYRCRANS